MQRLELAARVYDLFVGVCPVVLPVTLADTDRAKAILTRTPGISARNAIHAGVMLSHGITAIATFDAGFDRVDGVTRLALT